MAYSGRANSRHREPAAILVLPRIRVAAMEATLLPIMNKLGMHLTQVAPRSCGCRRTEARNSVQEPRRPCVWEAFGGRLGRR